MGTVHQLLRRHDDAGREVAKGLGSFHQPLSLGAQFQLRLLADLGDHSEDDSEDEDDDDDGDFFFLSLNLYKSYKLYKGYLLL